MNAGAPGALVLLVVFLGAATLLAPGAVAPSHPEFQPTAREHVLPPPLANVSQDPWRPGRGEDVVVYATLRNPEAQPRAVLLRYCRVEPDYACWPTSVRMQRLGGSTTWAGVIAWDGRFMRPDTVHVGYNMSIVYDDERAYDAPTANYNAPPSFPVESGGLYFFYRLGPAREGLDAYSGLPFVLAAVAAGALLVGLRVRRGGARRAP